MKLWLVSLCGFTIFLCEELAVNTAKKQGSQLVTVNTVALGGNTILMNVLLRLEEL